MSMAQREKDVECFYELLQRLEDRVGGKRKLKDCNGRMKWPKRGIYFFFENGETRTGAPEELRVVRVGTHGLKRGAKSTLWNRLRQHRGVLKHGGGYHGGSIFRHHVGLAIANRGNLSIPETWRNFRSDCCLERLVSQHIRAMPLLWIKVSDSPGPNSQRGYIERNAIALLSKNFDDKPSTNWLGHHAVNERIRTSGLWNVNHTDDSKYCPEFVGTLKDLVEQS